MSNIIELKPKALPQQQLTCPECNGYTWQLIITRIVIQGKEVNHTDLYCQSEGCDFSTPAIVILPTEEDED